LAEHDQLERAADLYEEAAELNEALRLRTMLQHWERVAELAAQLGLHEQAARAHENLGHSRRAAEAYEQAARQAAVAKPPDEARAAALYQKAAILYEDLFEDERAAACQRQVQQLLRLPEILVRGEAQDAFIEYHWNTLNLRVENVGFGPARRIAVAFDGPFEVGGTRDIRLLGPQKSDSLEIYIRSHKDQVGPKVPLGISVSYQDRRGTRYELNDCIPVNVIQQGLPGLLTGVTPVEINIGEVYQPGARRQEGGVVEIHRSGGTGLRLEADRLDRGPISIRGNGPPVQRCPNCNLPVEAQEHRYCPDCGTPLREDSRPTGGAQ
jgi:hypothetical protein